jgi:hypothetical protein
MSTTFSFVCHDCKTIIQLEKVRNALLVLPNILPNHQDHFITIINEDDQSSEDMYPSYKEFDIWTGKDGTLAEKYCELPEWDFEQFVEFVDKQLN